MELSKQLYREIEELQVKELFRAYNPDHMERKHILVTDGDLLQRLCRIKIEKALISSSERFALETASARTSFGISVQQFFKTCNRSSSI